jgi:pimeloyl-ACP methyl ester carboxylesterase
VLRDKFRLSCEGLDSTALAGGDDKADWEEPVIVYLDSCLELQGSGSEGALAAMCAVSGDSGILWPRRALAPRLAEDLPSTIPVSVIFAEDTWVDAKPAVDLTAARPGQVQVFVVPMSEHMVYIDNPSAFNEALAQKMR